MPAPPAQEARRGKLLHGLFWGGVGLAPIAILILLFGQSMGTLRIAVILAVLTIVMLAVSIALRPSVEMVRVDIEHRVLDEIERMRLRSREDITTAARNTHRALSDKIHVLSETVEDLRSQVDEASSMIVAHPAPGPSMAAPAAGVGVVRRTETVHVTRRTTTVDAGEDGGHTGTVYGSKSAVDGEWRERPEERPAPERRRPDQWDGAAAGDRWAAVRADEDGRELHVGERRSSVHRDSRGGTEFHVEDRWAALRRDEPPDHRFGEADWESTFRSLSSRPAPPALPAARGEAPDRYIDADHDREPVRDTAPPVGSRGRERERWEREHDRDRGTERRPDRDHDDRGRDRPSDRASERDRAAGRDGGYDRDRDRDRHHDRDRSDRDYDRDRARDRDRDRGSERGGYPRDHDRDRGHEWRPEHERHDRDRPRSPEPPPYERDRDRDRDRDRERAYDRGRGHERDRGYEREPERGRSYDDRGREHEPYPRPRSPHPSEYDR